MPVTYHRRNFSLIFHFDIERAAQAFYDIKYTLAAVNETLEEGNISIMKEKSLQLLKSKLMGYDRAFQNLVANLDLNRFTAKSNQFKLLYDLYWTSEYWELPYKFYWQFTSLLDDKQ